MQFSDILVQHLYFVNFDPVQQCEFDRQHLALVLKRNNDNKTLVVMPLTSQPNGDGVNKKRLGTISSLPPNLAANVTYAVFNQMRTVNANRFSAIKNGGTTVQVKVDNTTFYELLQLGVQDLLYCIGQDEKIGLLKQIYEQACLAKAKDLAYKIKKLAKEKEDYEEQRDVLYKEIEKLIGNTTYQLELKYVADGVDKIFESALKSSK